MIPDLGVSKWNPGVVMFNLEQGKIWIIWNEFKEHLEDHNWTQGAIPQSSDFTNLDFILSLEGLRTLDQDIEARRTKYYVTLG